MIIDSFLRINWKKCRVPSTMLVHSKCLVNSIYYLYLFLKGFKNIILKLIRVKQFNSDLVGSLTSLLQTLDRFLVSYVIRPYYISYISRPLPIYPLTSFFNRFLMYLFSYCLIIIYTSLIFFLHSYSTVIETNIYWALCNRHCEKYFT